MLRENLDRYGNLRCAGYRKEDFELCPRCSYRPEPRIECSLCGGYGEIPLRTAKEQQVRERC